MQEGAHQYGGRHVYNSQGFSKKVTSLIIPKATIPKLSLTIHQRGLNIT